MLVITTEGKFTLLAAIFSYSGASLTGLPLESRRPTLKNDQVTLDPDYRAIEIPSVVVTEGDDTGVAVSTTGITVQEGSSVSYTVVLDSAPKSDVEIAVTRADGDQDLSVPEGLTLLFTPANWSTPQQVTITAAKDNDGLNGSATFVHNVTSTDPSYLAIKAPNVVATEKDQSGVTVSPTAISVDEGSSASYTIVLDSEPSTAVEIVVTRLDGDQDLSVTDGSRLLFTRTNWSTPQQVTIAAVQDDDRLGGTATFIHETISSLPDYSGITVDRVSATENEAEFGIFPLWLQLSSILLLLVCALVYFSFVHRRRESDHTKDSPDFKKALEIWIPIVKTRRDSPRHLKRFVNRVRYLATLSFFCPSSEETQDRSPKERPSSSDDTEKQSDTASPTQSAPTSIFRRLRVLFRLESKRSPPRPSKPSVIFRISWSPQVHQATPRSKDENERPTPTPGVRSVTVRLRRSQPNADTTPRSHEERRSRPDDSDNETESLPPNRSIRNGVLGKLRSWRKQRNEVPTQSNRDSPEGRQRESHNPSEATLVALAALQSLSERRSPSDSEETSLPECVVSAFSDSAETRNDTAQEYKEWIDNTFENLGGTLPRDRLDTALMDHRNEFTSDKHLITKQQIQRFREITKSIIVR